jgi:hypothetical protein
LTAPDLFEPCPPPTVAPIVDPHVPLAEELPVMSPVPIVLISPAMVPPKLFVRSRVLFELVWFPVKDPDPVVSALNVLLYADPDTETRESRRIDIFVLFFIFIYLLFKFIFFLLAG